MSKEIEIGNIIMDMSDDPSPIERVDLRSNELIDLIRSSKGNIGLVLNDKDLTDLIIKVSKGANPKELIDYIKAAVVPVSKKFSELINFSECSFGLSISEVPRVESDEKCKVLYNSDDRKIMTIRNFGFIIDKVGRNYQVKKFSTNGSINDLTKWKFINKKLATKESLASVVK